MDTLPTEPSSPVTEDQLIEMSDEQINELDFSSFEQDTTEAPEEGAEVVEENDDELSGPSDDGDEPTLDEGEEAPEPDEGSDNDLVVEEPAEAPAEEEAGEEAPEADPEKTADEKPAEEGEIDYKAEYEKLFTPFNANGKQIKVDNADDAIQLMQMGANYAKKMAALKPNLKLMKMLENNQLLSEERLSYYIDLEKKNPEAIKKFIKESGIDPLDLDLDGKNEYTPGNHTVDDRAVDLDLVLDEIKDSPSYSKTLGIVSSKWDQASKQTIYDQPQLLKVINSHVDNGVYELISGEIERERMLGRLAGVSDLDAYRTVGDAIQARGGFNHLFKESAPAEQEKPQPVVKTAAKPKASTADPKRNQQRRAASPTARSAPAPSTPADFNPLGISDAEFEKLSGLPI